MIQQFGSPYSMKGRLCVYYYIFLSLLTLFLTRPDFVLGGPHRIAYLIMVMLPLLFYRKYIPVVFTFFVGFSFSSFYPLLPSKLIFYPIMVLIFYGTSFQRLNTIVLLFLFAVSYFFFIEAFSLNPNYDFIIWIVASLFLSELIQTKQDINSLLLIYAMLSLLLSIVFLINFEHFATQYMDSSMERSGWINPNVFGGIIGLGTVCSFYLLLNKLYNCKIARWLIVITCVLSYFVLIINASRGAILSTTCSVLVLFIISKVRPAYKLFILLTLVMFMVALYKFGAFNLLEARLMSDNTASAGGRSYIWNAKLSAFGHLPILNRFFGVGYSDCLSLGGVYMDTHNDFLTALFAYGYIGLCLFILFLIGPIILSPRHVRKKIIVFELFISMEAMVLSPIMRGYFLFIMFIFALYRLAYIERKAMKHSMI